MSQERSGAGRNAIDRERCTPVRLTETRGRGCNEFKDRRWAALVCRFLRIEFAWRPSRPFSGLIVLSSARRQPARRAFPPSQGFLDNSAEPSDRMRTQQPCAPREKDQRRRGGSSRVLVLD